MDQKPDPERLRRLEEAVLQVPRLNRQIFLAARVDDMSVAEIARRTGLSQRQVIKRLGRAIKVIGRHLRSSDAD
ncbi:RNA polymerase sigma factor [Novosphingobium kaempferiae]|uniref:RNA polymerase sigma factor n=1 Tax=Novosphingobium kaempferiae TaxID=2896849 RepID=UPI001E353E80|nr:sigma factor-like helix-turn-helix DNA-binding protein [Novosphingobium kaempferiae]